MLDRPVAVSQELPNAPENLFLCTSAVLRTSFQERIRSKEANLESMSTIKSREKIIFEENFAEWRRAHAFAGQMYYITRHNNSVTLHRHVGLGMAPMRLISPYTGIKIDILKVTTVEAFPTLHC